MNFGQWINRHLKEINTSRAVLFRKAEMNSTNGYLWERGQKPTKKSIRKIIPALASLMGIKEEGMWEDLIIVMGEQYDARAIEYSGESK